MIVNTQQDNTIEGNYLRVQSVKGVDTLVLKVPDHFTITENNFSHWMIGWGTGQPLHDAGVENIRAIQFLDLRSGTYVLGKLFRGDGFPARGQRVVFWNDEPSGFIKEKREPVIDPHWWPGFAGESIGFGSIVYDSLSRQWVMFVNEVDTDAINVYAAVSNDLKNWSAAHDGKPVFRSDDFKNTSWGGLDKTGMSRQTPVLSDVIRVNGKWYFIMDGYNRRGKRNIGVVIGQDSLFGPYEIQNNPILGPGPEGSWNDAGCFYAKVCRFQNSFVVFYDGINSQGKERIGKATSEDLVHWSEYDDNPVLDQHDGWRSSVHSSEPNFVEVRGDSIFLMVAGTKEFKLGPWNHYVTGRMYKDKSGNVGDAQLGVFLSVDGGNSFIPNSNNPVFVNNYADEFENEHMGGNFKLIESDSADFIFYQAKSSFGKVKYGINCRIRRKLNP